MLNLCGGDWYVGDQRLLHVLYYKQQDLNLKARFHKRGLV